MQGEMLELAAKECTRSDVFTGQEAYGEYTNVLNKIMAAGILLGAVCWAGKAWFLQGFLNWTFPARVLGISLVLSLIHI